jgi:KDO2-lipid IV(A) lauroyltransferase
MSKDFITDYLSCILFRIAGPFFRVLPKGFSLFLGRRLGDLLYYFNLKQKAVAYSNIKTAFGDKLSSGQLCKLTRQFYQAFGQNIIEIFFIPLVDKRYLDKYICFEGLKYIDEAFKKGRGVILLGVHSGSWELSNIICANLGFPFNLFVRDQRYPRLNELLNLYRTRKGCKIIQRKNQTRYLIESLKKNEAIGMTADQGGKGGALVKFFGKDASMATGAVRLALRYGSVILPAFYARVSGPYIRTIIESPFEVKNTGDAEKDIRDNLQEIIRVFEKNIERYPQDYFWSYKVWKYSKERRILILSDGKAGHLRQAEAAAKIVSDSLKDRAIISNVATVEIKFKNSFTKKALTFSSLLAGKYHCQGCLWCLRAFLPEDTYKSLIGMKPDIIISCGSSVAPINYVLSRENLAKSIVIMKPSILSAARFNLAVIPQHDSPFKRKNIVVTEGALNLIDEGYLREQSEKLMRLSAQTPNRPPVTIGLLIGGDTKGFHLDGDTVSEVIKQVKSASEKLDADILVTTSRRTSREVELKVKEEFQDYSRCRLLIIANEKNIPEAVGGILGLSRVVITSSESISMISEAVNSGKYVLVFESPGLNRRRQRFLEHFAKNRYIYLVDSPCDLSRKIEDIWLNRPPVYTTRDNLIVSEAIKKIL